MDILFSFLEPDHQHNTLLAGYFSKVVMCLALRKTAALMNYIQDHQEILRQLVDLIGITSIMEALIRLIGADENANYVDEMQWLKDTNVLEMIVDKFSSSDSPQVHANAAEVLCAVIQYAPPGLAAKICSSSFMGRLFHHALEDSRPKSVLVHSLSICISLLDPKRLVSASYNLFRSQLTHGSLVVADPETVDRMLESLGDLLKLLDVSSAAIFFPTTYGYLKPPFGRHRLKIVEFISVLLTIGSEAAERQLVERGAIKHILNMFFEYPFNNILHRTVENIIALCLESKSDILIQHLLLDCDIVNKILDAEKQPLLSADCSKPTISTRGRLPPRIGIFGHMTRIANKLLRSANSSSIIQTHLQENKEWVFWCSNILLKRNATENVCQWACGRPNALMDQLRDFGNESVGDRDDDVAALSNNFNEAISYEGTEEDMDSDNRFAEVTSSDHTAEDPENVSLSTNAGWFSHEEGRVGSESDAEELGTSTVDNGPMKGSEDTTPLSLLTRNEELTESNEDISDSNELPDSDASSADEDGLNTGNMIKANEEDCKEHAITFDLKFFPAPKTGDIHAGPSEEAIEITTDTTEEPGRSTVDNAEDTRPSSLLNCSDEPTESIGGISDSDDLPDSDPIASPANEDATNTDDTIEARGEDFKEDACVNSENSCAEITTSPAATPSADEDDDILAKQAVSSEDQKHEQNSSRGQGG
ncbi:uncharacterized protein A4U43_C06F19170 [Asparagus officinalis]|uniref:Uncharacterized protein n=1 Tax=Asparagus officinalis TaxID=4686 RepID=A0A5P1EMW6_ASPOF|nr:serine/threonine-protein phosphatase 6 regulatory subunit 3-like isoform X2 [Asparagus officinalis]ONK67342.1 uncharacterized protein A4U43_C06F19170 [Asparagus officinalis]